MKNIKLLLWVLSCILCLALFISCNGEEPRIPTPDGGDQSTDDGESVLSSYGDNVIDYDGVS